MKPFRFTLFCLSILLIVFGISAASAPQSTGGTSGFGILRDSAWSVDGTHFLMVTGSSAQVYTWDGSNLELQSDLESTRHPRSGVLTSNGNMAFLGTEEGVIEQWDVLDGEQINEWEAHRLPILDLALNGDDSLLLSIGWRADAMVWNTATGEKQSTLKTSSIGAATGSFAPDGSVVLWSKEFKLQFFNPQDGSLTQSRSTQYFNPTPVFSPDGSLLAGIYNGQALVIESANGRLVQALNADFTITHIAISRDKTQAALLGSDSQYLLYDLSNGFLLESWQGNPGQVYRALQFSPDNEHLFLLGTAIHSRNLRLLGFFSQFHVSGRADETSVSADGQVLASRAEKLNYVEVWQNGVSKPVQTFENFPVPVMDARFLSDGRLLISADSLTFWDASSGELLEEWVLPLPEGMNEFAVWVYDPDTRQSQQVKLDRLPLGRLGISQDGRQFAVEGMDGRVYVWDLISSKPQPVSFPLSILNTSKNMDSSVKAFLFSSDHTQLLAWLSDDTLRIFDLQSEQETASFILLASLPAFEESCMQQWDASRQVLSLADDKTIYEYDTTNDSVTEITNGICGFNGSDYTIHTSQLDLPQGTLSIQVNEKEIIPRQYSPQAAWLLYQSGRFSDFSLSLRNTDPESHQADLFQTLTADQYQLAATKANHYSFDGDSILTIDAEGTQFLNGSIQTTLSITPAALTITNDGEQTLLSAYDGRVLLQQNNNLITLLTEKNRPDIVRALAFSSDGSLKAAGDDVGLVHLWNTNNVHSSFETPGGAVQEILFSPDDAYLAVRGTNSISVWQLSLGSQEYDAVMLNTTPKGTAMAFSPDGSFFLTSTRDNFEYPLLVWSFPALERQQRYNIPTQQIVFASNTSFYLISDDLWHCNLGENCLKMYVPETFTTGDLHIAPDETRAFLITIDGRVVKLTLTE